MNAYIVTALHRARVRVIRFSHSVREMYRIGAAIAAYEGARYNVALFLRDVIADELRHMTCLVFGHQWHSEGTASPDHGDEYIYCKRCQELHHVIYY